MIIGIDNYGDPYSMREMRDIVQEGIDAIDKDFFTEYLEESDEEITPEDYWWAIDEFKFWFINWKLSEADDFPRKMRYFTVYEDGEIEEIGDPRLEEIFPLDSFNWKFEWLE